MSSGSDRADLSIHAAHLLRDRAARVDERVGRKGRPRARFLDEQRQRLAGWSTPVMATVAALTGAVAAMSLASDAPNISQGAAIAEACVAIVVGGAAIGTQLARRSNALLIAFVATGFIVALLGWGFVARMTGETTSRYLLIAPLILVVAVGIVPMPPRVAYVVAPAGYVALLVASARAPIIVHFLVLAIAVGGVLVARARHKLILRSFHRMERLSAAVKRMRRVQEQLVLVEKLEALRVLVGGMAHELNNALAISTASNRLAQGKLAEDPTAAKKALERSDGGLARIAATVNRLRRFAMAAEGRREAADVASMLDFALESAIGRARSGVAIERAYDDKVGTIKCHVPSLAEALFQVARNAVEAMPSGGTIRASVKADGDRVVLSVADEGKGIPAEQLSKVFDPYWQAANKANKSGMGLSTVYGLVSAVGGSLKLESEEGKGTTVAIRIPREESRDREPPSEK